MDTSFFPNAARATRIDSAVRSRLAGSLEAVLTALDAVALEGTGTADLAALLRAIRTGPVRPAVMALYADLVEAVFTGKEGTVAALLSALSLPAWRVPAGWRAVTLDDASLGPGVAALLARHIGDDPSTAVSLAPLSAEAMATAGRVLAEGQALLRAALPELAGELEALVNEVVLVGSPPLAGTLVFHGASSFFLWGGLALNAAAHPTRLTIVEGLAHEGAHSLLHGLSEGANLTKNDPAQRHPSPLRHDPRPMEGIAHASFVLARMWMAMEGMLHSGLLDAAEREAATARHAAIGRDYAAGMAVVDGHAQLTPLGAALLDGARRYMAVEPPEGKAEAAGRSCAA